MIMIQKIGENNSRRTRTSIDSELKTGESQPNSENLDTLSSEIQNKVSGDMKLVVETRNLEKDIIVSKKNDF